MWNHVVNGRRERTEGCVEAVAGTPGHLMTAGNSFTITLRASGSTTRIPQKRQRYRLAHRWPTSQPPLGSVPAASRLLGASRRYEDGERQRFAAHDAARIRCWACRRDV